MSRSETGYYFLDYRVWWDKGFLWLEIGTTAIPIAAEDALQVAEMLIRATNDRKWNPDFRVRSTDEPQ